MPLGCEPGRTFRVVLKSDEDKTVAERPWFEFRYLSKRAWGNLITETRKKVVAAIDELDAKQKEDTKNKVRIWAIETPDFTNIMLEAGLTNWFIIDGTGKTIPFDSANIDAYVTNAEADELLAKFREQGFGAEERKN